MKAIPRALAPSGATPHRVGHTLGAVLSVALLTACQSGSDGSGSGGTGGGTGGGNGGGGNGGIDNGLGGGGSVVAKPDDDEPPGPGPNGSYLYVSAPEFYFGTRDVGTVTTQQIELVNRGADIYPLNSLVVTGEHAEEFTTDLHEPVTLNPAEAVRVNVTFTPIDEGRKFAELDIDFDTIVQADEATNRNEQRYYRARELERRREYGESRAGYADYVSNHPITVNKQRAAMKLPIIDEAERYGEGEDFALYLAALNAREAGDFARATDEIDTLLLLYGESYLADDALYLKGYIALMDRQDHAAALKSLQRLKQDYPDTTYYDTALYGEALAQRELGNDALARSIFLDLRFRHTGVDALGITLPKDDLVSRLWFERASDGLASLDAA